MTKLPNSALEFDQFLNNPPKYENDRVREYRHAAYGEWKKVCGDIAKLQAKIAKLKANAERYQWLREKGMDFSVEFATGEFQRVWLAGGQMDNAVDAERGQVK